MYAAGTQETGCGLPVHVCLTTPCAAQFAATAAPVERFHGHHIVAAVVRKRPHKQRCCPCADSLASCRAARRHRL